MSWLLDLASNPVFAGVAGGAGVSAALYQIRALPLRLWDWILRRLTITLEIDNSDDLFHRLAVHLSRSPYVQRAKWLRMVELYDDQEQRWRWAASFGQGRHLIRDCGHWFLIWRKLEEKSGGLTLTRRETMTIRCMSSARRALGELMLRAEEVFDQGNTIRVHLYHDGGYMLADRRPSRGWDSLFIPAAQKGAIIEDLDRFLGAKEVYRRRGVPYRRGYLFKGPPGTGKTTLAFCIASYSKRPLYLINLNTCGGDTGLQAAFNRAEPGAIVVIEDIDTARISHDRTAPPPAGAEVKVEQKSAESVTLAGLLNAIDGLASRENRVLIVTSNHAEMLDPALLRPGRIDRQEHIGLIERPEALAMVRAFMADELEASRWFAAEVEPALPMSPADLQGVLLARIEQGPGPNPISLKQEGIPA